MRTFIHYNKHMHTYTHTVPCAPTLSLSLFLSFSRALPPPPPKHFYSQQKSHERQFSDLVSRVEEEKASMKQHHQTVLQVNLQMFGQIFIAVKQSSGFQNSASFHFCHFLPPQDLQQDVEAAHAVINQLKERERRRQTDYDSKV